MNATTLILDAQELPIAARLLEEVHPRSTLAAESQADLHRALALVRLAITRAQHLEGIIASELTSARP